MRAIEWAGDIAALSPEALERESAHFSGRGSGRGPCRPSAGRWVSSRLLSSALSSDDTRTHERAGSVPRECFFINTEI